MGRCSLLEGLRVNSQPSEHLASATKENGLSSGYRLSLNWFLRNVSRSTAPDKSSVNSRNTLVFYNVLRIIILQKCTFH